MSKVYLDQDGVLVDFDKGLEKFNVKNSAEHLNIPKEQWTPLQVELDRQVLDCMKTPGFFMDLPKMPGADELWKLAQSNGPMAVLTALPKTTDDAERVASEKAWSIAEHFSLREEDEFITCLRSQKKNYATYDKLDRIEKGVHHYKLAPNILVDDLEANIEQWREAGGYGILFKTMEQAVEDLKKVLDVANTYS